MSGLPGSRHLIAGKLALIDADRLVPHSFRHNRQGDEEVSAAAPFQTLAPGYDGIRAGIDAGSLKACEAAVEATGGVRPEADGVKAACKAAITSKPGAQTPATYP
jgi:hypothetical protein